MVDLKLPGELGSLPTQSSWDFGHFIMSKFDENLIISKGIILKRLYGLSAIDILSEDIVKTKLSWEHVHHNFYSTALVRIILEVFAV